MNWKPLTHVEQLTEIDEKSQANKVLIFKHSTRCSISHAALARLERNWKTEYTDQLPCYFLDLLQHRELSNAIAQHYAVAHESPQALLIHKGKCLLNQTHSGIDVHVLAKI
jgi:bacillithiol system protein YtxJ